MLSDGIFAIATTLAALEIRFSERSPSLGALLGDSAISLAAYLLSFMLATVFWIANRELFARVARTDTILTLLTLGSLCGIAVLPAAIRVFFVPGGMTIGFKFYCLVMFVCGSMNSAMWIYAAARPGVMRADVPRAERWARALPALMMPVVFLACMILARGNAFWVAVPAAIVMIVFRRVVVPRLRATKAVENAA